jgi:hypothetical protein
MSQDTNHLEPIWDFFLAYAREDQAHAAALFLLLRDRAKVFFAPECIAPGAEWDAELRKALLWSRNTLVLVSPSSNSAYYQREEIATALRRSYDPGAHRVIPLFFGGTSPADEALPYGLRLKNGIVVAESDALPAAAERILSLLDAPPAESKRESVINGSGEDGSPSTRLETPRRQAEAEILLVSDLPRHLAKLDLDPAATLIRAALAGVRIRGTLSIDQWTHVCKELHQRGMAGVPWVLRLVDEVQNTVFSKSLSGWAAAYVAALLRTHPRWTAGGGGLGLNVVEFCRREKERWGDMEEEAKRWTEEDVSRIAGALRTAWGTAERQVARGADGSTSRLLKNGRRGIDSRSRL